MLYVVVRVVVHMYIYLRRYMLCMYRYQMLPQVHVHVVCMYYV